MGSISNDRQLQLLLKFLCESVNSKVELNSKLLRDILDVVEGLMRQALNSKGKYDHSSLKLNCGYISKNAKALKLKNIGNKLVKLTHREHAIPLKIVLVKLYDLIEPSPDSLKSFLDDHLISVLITKSEQLLLDSSDIKLKCKMPLDWDGVDAFARFNRVGIEIVEGK